MSESTAKAHNNKIRQEYVLWNAASVPLLQFARY